MISHLDRNAAITSFAATTDAEPLLVEDSKHLLADEHLRRHAAHPHLLLRHLRLWDSQVCLTLVTAHRPAPVGAHPSAHAPAHVLMLETMHGAFRQE